MEEIRADMEMAGERLDALLSRLLEDGSRTFFQKLIKDGMVTVNEKVVKPSYVVDPEDLITIDYPELKALEIEAQDIPLDVVYEDSDVILVNKPRGMVVHPAPGHYRDTMVNALLYHCSDLSGINGVMRPGIVHRIDRDTTGIVIACKNDRSHQCIAEQLKEHSIKRRYLCIVNGNLKEDEGTIEGAIGRSPKDRKKMAITPDGKEAVTHYRVLERFGDYTYVECRLETGRTHQIRVHMTSIGHPLLGDEVYGQTKSRFHTEGQLLHAYVLGFNHPEDGRYLEFSAPLPEDFQRILDALKKCET